MKYKYLTWLYFNCIYRNLKSVIRRLVCCRVKATVHAYYTISLLMDNWCQCKIKISKDFSHIPGTDTFILQHWNSFGLKIARPTVIRKPKYRIKQTKLAETKLELKKKTFNTSGLVAFAILLVHFVYSRYFPGGSDSANHLFLLSYF